MKTNVRNFLREQWRKLRSRDLDLVVAALCIVAALWLWAFFHYGLRR